MSKRRLKVQTRGPDLLISFYLFFFFLTRRLWSLILADHQVIGILVFICRRSSKFLIMLYFFYKTITSVWGMSWIVKSLNISLVKKCSGFPSSDRMILMEDFAFGYFVSKTTIPRRSLLVSIRIIGNGIARSLFWAHFKCVERNVASIRIFGFLASLFFFSFSFFLKKKFCFHFSFFVFGFFFFFFNMERLSPLYELKG